VLSSVASDILQPERLSPVDVHHVPPGSAWTWSGESSFVYCVSGVLRFGSESGLFVIREGMALWCPKGVSVSATSMSGAEVLVVSLPWVLEDVRRPFGHECSPLLSQMMLYLWSARRDERASMPIHPVVEALHNLLPVWTRGAHSMGLPLPTDGLLREALQWMHDRLDQPVGPAAGAAHVGLSVRSFQRRCQKELGMTPITWLQRARIMRSCELLMDPDQSVASVAIACGYRSQASFGRVFKTHMAVTPAIWRHRSSVR